ncbi:MAG TPA: hypothetical protein O0X27_01900 [Methanocorpusculum sp.]|nr:hypothetical protein [Methanocorpusculum sp.]
MTLTPKQALMQYHMAERAKLDIMMIAHQLITVPTLNKEDKPGAKFILGELLEVLAADLQGAASCTGRQEFTQAASGIDEVISLVKSNQFGIASDKCGEAMIPVTSVAADAFAVLSEAGLL